MYHIEDGASNHIGYKRIRRTPGDTTYMTIPVAWSAAEAHRAVDAVAPPTQRPYRMAWEYDAEIAELKAQLKAARAARDDLDHKNAQLHQTHADAYQALAELPKYKVEKAAYITALNERSRELADVKKQLLDFDMYKGFANQLFKLTNYAQEHRKVLIPDARPGDEVTDHLLALLKRIVTTGPTDAQQQDNESLKKMLDHERAFYDGLLKALDIYGGPEEPRGALLKAAAKMAESLRNDVKTWKGYVVGLWNALGVNQGGGSFQDRMQAARTRIEHLTYPMREAFTKASDAFDTLPAAYKEMSRHFTERQKTAIARWVNARIADEFAKRGDDGK